MTPDQIDKLLDIAGVSRGDENARWRLEMAASHLPTGTRPTGQDWNEPLAEIAEQAEKLNTSIRKLRVHRHQHVDFWRLEQWGPVGVDQETSDDDETAGLVNPAPDYRAAGETGFERAGVLSLLANVAEAAKAAQLGDKGRPANRRKRATVEAAWDFLQLFRPDAPLSGTPKGLFYDFAAALYEAVGSNDTNGKGTKGKGTKSTRRRADSIDRAVREVAAERVRQN